MESRRPEYYQRLIGLSFSGRATRPWCEVEARLCVCRHCPGWDDKCGCPNMTPAAFAAFLANASATCPDANSGKPSKDFQKS